MKTASLRQVSDLPILDELSDPSWGASFQWVTDDLFKRPYQGLLRTPSGDLFVYRHADLAALRIHPSSTHQTLEALTHGMRVPDSMTESGLARWLGVNTFSMREPKHKPGKALLVGTMSPRNLGPIGGGFAEAFDSVLDAALARDTIDFVSDVIQPAVARFWGLALGYSVEEGSRLMELTSQMAETLRVNPRPEHIVTANQAAHEFMAVQVRAMERSHRSGAYPWVEHLVTNNAAIPDPLRPKDPFAHLATALFDGFRSLVGIASSVVFAMLEAGLQPQQIERDVAGFASAAFLEGTRLHPALISLPRQAANDFEYDGIHIPADTNIHMAWMFGNRDPAVFERPTDYLLERDNRLKQFTFGGGLYVCAGRSLVQAVCEWVLVVMAERGIAIERTGDVVWNVGTAEHEIMRFPVALRQG